jgi:hypothetical protein
MKAWEDLINDDSISLYWTEYSDWYLDCGVKIEKFKDGTIELWNAATQGDHYAKLSATQESYFNDYGWKPGLYKVKADRLEYKLESLEYYLTKKTDDSERATMQRSIDRIRTELDDTNLKLRKSLEGIA